MEKKTFKLETQWGETMDVQLDINNYMNNDGLYIGLNCIDEDGDLDDIVYIFRWCVMVRS